jgi:peptidoglycan/LPS O-acetylase OafA/YrhL
MRKIFIIRDAVLTPSNRAAIPRKMAAPLHPNYRPDIDGLRAVAVLPVLVYHAFPRWMPAGFVGVDIFFVISGFLISTVIMGNLEEGRFSYFDFYSRRIRRIFPALAVMLIVVLAFGWVSLFPVEFKALGKHVLGAATFISNFLLWNESGYFDRIAESKPLLHLWSLGIEEQYYIFWPLILSIAWRYKRSLPVVIFSIGTASFLFSLLELKVHPVATFYSPVTRMWELMIGSALAYVFTVRVGRRCPSDAVISMFLSPIGAILLLTGFLSITAGRSFPGWWATLPTFGSVLLIAGGSGSWVNRWLLSNRWMVLVGKISYPLYLWHWPLLSFAQILYAGSPPLAVKIFLLLAAFLLAWITFRFIERPIRYGDRMSSATMPLVAIAVVIALMGAFIYLEDGLTSRNIVAYNSALLQEHVFASNPPSQCRGIANDVISKNRLCTIYPAEAPIKTIVLWGDSSTEAWLPVFLDIGKQHSYSIVNLSHPSCPPILAARKTRFDYRESREYCQDGQMQLMALQEIERMHPDLIVIIAAWNTYSERTNREFVTDRSDEVADAASTKRTLFARVPETLKKLTEVSRTVVFRSWPIMPIARNQKIARALAIPGTRPIYTKVEGPTVSRNEFIEDSRNINSIFDHLESPRLSFFDPSIKICASGTCESHFDGINYYSDDYHISVEGALSFRADIEALLDR